MFLFDMLPVFSDDAYLTAYFADAFVNGQGFPNSNTETLLGITDPLYLYIVGLLIFLGLNPVTSMHIVNSLAIFLIFSLVKKEKGNSALLAVICFFSLWYHLLIGAGNGLFVLFFLLYLVDYRKGSAVWISLAAATRFDFALYWIYAFFQKYKEKNIAWCIRSIFVFVPVLVLNFIFWGTFMPHTLLSKKLMYNRLFMLNFQVPDHIQWLLASVCIALIFKEIDRRAVFAGIALSLSWAIAGISPGNAYPMLGFLILISFIFGSSKYFDFFFKKHIFITCCLASLLTFPQFSKTYQKWADHYHVSSEMVKLMPEEGCTLAYWYFGYLRHHSDKCIIDGSGFFDRSSFELLKETQSNEIFLRLPEKPSAVIHFHEPDVEPLKNLPEYPFSRNVRGKHIQGIIYSKDF